MPLQKKKRSKKKIQTKGTQDKRSLIMRLSEEFYAHIRLVFQDGYTMEFISPVECHKTGRTWKDKADLISQSRPVAKRLVKFHAQGTAYDTLSFTSSNSNKVKEF